MKAHIKIEGDVLSTWLYDVGDTEQGRGRAARVEMDFLRFYTKHRAEKVRYNTEGKLIYSFHRGDSNHTMLDGCLNILADYCLKNESAEDWAKDTKVAR